MIFPYGKIRHDKKHKNTKVNRNQYWKNFNYVTMCHKLGIGTTTWYRWINGSCEPTNKNIIEKIDKVINENQ